MGDGPGDGLDDERARLVDSIYEAVLRAEHYDAFMDDFSKHIELAARRLGNLRVTSGAASETYSDPVIEVHFERAFAMLERMGRGPDASRLDRRERQDPPLLCVDRHGVLRMPAGREPSPADVTERFWQSLDSESVSRLRALVSTIGRAPLANQFVILSRAGAIVGEAGLMSATTASTPDGGMVIEVRRLELSWPAALETILGDTFRLTPRETEVVRGLVEGHDLATIAARGARSLETVRSQLKSVFQKTRIGSQADLVRMISALIMYSPTDPRPTLAAAELDHGTVVAVADEGGRDLPVHLIGPADGIPVVFIHGMLDGIGVTRRVVAELAASGIRLVAPVRANFGSAPADGRVREAPALFAARLARILDALGIERPLLLGHMAGSLYAFAAASRLGQRAAGVVAVSGGVPIRSMRQFSLMTPRQRTVAYTARFAPALLPAILRAGIAQIDSSDVVRFMNALYLAGTRDRAVVEHPAIAAAIVDGYRFSVAQGARAFQIDSWHVTRDWSELVVTSGCPALLLHGHDDPVVNIETVREFAATSNRLELVELPEEGQLLFYSQPQAVLSAIAAFARRTR